jgi:integrase
MEFFFIGCNRDGYERKEKRIWKMVEDYLVRHYKNINTRDTVRVYLKKFFEAIGKDPKQWLKQTQRSIKDDIFEYIKLIENEPNKTQITSLNILKKFLERNEKELKKIEWEEIRQRNNLVRNVRPTVKKATPTPVGLKKILSYASGIKAKAYFVLLASSGIRRDEALKLTWDDIDLDERRIDLNEEVAKGGIPRFTFITEEAKELLELWKPEREKRLMTLHRKSTTFRKILESQGYDLKKFETKSTATVQGKKYYVARWKAFKDGKEVPKEELVKLDNRIFPYEAENFQKMWSRMLEKVGEPYNKKDLNPKLKMNKYLYNIHSLRRFWFTQLRAKGMNPEYYNYIGGHTSLLDRTYGDWLEDTIMQKKMREEFDSHNEGLCIFEAKPDLTDVHEKLAEKDKQIQDLKNMMDEMKAQITELRLEKLEKINGIKK